MRLYHSIKWTREKLKWATEDEEDARINYEFIMEMNPKLQIKYYDDPAIKEKGEACKKTSEERLRESSGRRSRLQKRLDRLIRTYKRGQKNQACQQV